LREDVYGWLKVKDVSYKKIFFILKICERLQKTPQQFDLKKKKWPFKKRREAI